MLSRMRVFIAVAILTLGGCGEQTTPATVQPTNPMPIATPEAGNPPISDTSDSGLQYFWIDPPAQTEISTIPELTSANEAGWSIYFEAPNNPGSHLSLNGGERDPVPIDTEAEGVSRKPLTVHGRDAILETSVNGIRIAWHEGDMHYNLVAGPDFSEEAVLDMIERLDSLSLTEWQDRLTTSR